ncbi:MAG: flagellar hook-length control protein FliK [Lachnospiraceae bacterium]|nr:flagellar hook-length control protein FliK [Lachnospiraceae bacterium]
MNLSELFFGNNQISNSIQTPTGQSAPTQADVGAALTRTIMSLIPGSTITGEILSRDSDLAQVKIAGDLILNAKIDAAINLETGKPITFEVKNNGKNLSLSPLFTNTASTQTVTKALNMAQLPVNDVSVSMTQNMMSRGMSIDINSLQNTYKEVLNFGAENLNSIVSLREMNSPVSEKTIAEYKAVAELEFKMEEGVGKTFDNLSKVYESMVESGDDNGAVKLLNDLQNLYDSFKASGASGETLATNSDPTLQSGVLTGKESANGEVAINGSANNGVVNSEATVNTSGKELVPDAETKLNEELLKNFSATEISVQGKEAVNSQAESLSADLKAQTLGETPEKALNAEGKPSLNFDPAQNKDVNILNSSESLFKEIPDKEISSALFEKLKTMVHLNEKELASKEEVRDHFLKVSKMGDELGKLIDNIAVSEKTAALIKETVNGLNNLSENLEFINQFNNLYTFMQMPFKSLDGREDGDLYIYANKRNLAESEGTITAFLHLSTNNMGPVDVYVALHGENISTNFYVENDRILDFLEANMDLLNKRLTEKGYNLEVSASLSKDMKNDAGLPGIKTDPASGEGGGSVSYGEYSFDVRT